MFISLLAQRNEPKKCTGCRRTAMPPEAAKTGYLVSIRQLGWYILADEYLQSLLAKVFKAERKL